MSCQHLVCAQCAHPVIEGRCALCRANRERLHGHGFAGLSPALIAVVLLVALFATLVLEHLLGV
ncbi:MULTISPECIES: hypothetical protein [Nonomuraea]|uniref:Uncharacterized protein n=2 Tax=Nonomuraea TaxID=83681 RepID=A0ABW1BQ21_9ACTN|nr:MULTISPECIES: hypothetical protein [Nonomuraea]MDA0645475.1 hypothetical protein [Nonomuraea ferruginea]